MKTLPLCAAIFALVACAGAPQTSSVADDATYDVDYEDAPLFECEGSNTFVQVFPTYSNDNSEHEVLVKIKKRGDDIEETVDAKYDFSVRYGGYLQVTRDVQLHIEAEWDDDTYDITGFSGWIEYERSNRTTALDCEATKFEPQSYVRDRALNDFLKAAKDASDSEMFGNAALADAYRLHAVPRSERFEQTIKQLLFGTWDDGVIVDRQDNSYSTVDDAIDMLTGTDTGWGERHRDPDEIRSDLKRKLKAAIYHRDHMKVFTGEIESDFCWELGYVAIIDTRNDQMVVYGEGACE